MAIAKKYVIGLLTLIVLATLVTITFQNQAKIEVGKLDTKFYINESDKWILTGTEQLLISGTKYSSATITNIRNIKQQTTETIRITKFKDKSQIKDTYYFSGKTTDIELFPMEHKIQVINASGKIFIYNATLINPVFKDNAIVADKNMKIEFDKTPINKQIVGNTVTLKFLITSNNEPFNIRMFDPDTYKLCYQENTNIYNNSDGSCFLKYTGNYQYYDASGNPSGDTSPAYDGSWTTKYNFPLETDANMIFINYTKPPGVNNNSIWMAKAEINSVVLFVNMSIPNTCFNRNNNVIELIVINDEQVYYTTTLLFGCVTGSNWYNYQSLGSLEGTGEPYNQVSFYEDAMIWNVTDIILLPNITNPSINNTGFNYKTQINFSITNVSTGINNCWWTADMGITNNSVSCVSGNNQLPPKLWKFKIDKVTGNSSNFCYQEFSNVSTTCGGVNTGRYATDSNLSNMVNSELAYDGDWSTFGETTTTSLTKYIYMNYTLPSSLVKLDGTKWRYKLGNGTDTNYTFAGAAALRCINPTYIGTTFRGRIRFLYSAPNTWTYVDCLRDTGTTWVTALVTAVPGTLAYEEGMYWNITSNIYGINNNSQYNLTIFINDTYGNIVSNTRSFYLTEQYNLANPQIANVITTTPSNNNSRAYFVSYYINDTTPIDSCWYSLDNGITNTSLESNACNGTIPRTWVPAERLNISIWSNNSYGNLSYIRLENFLTSSPLDTYTFCFQEFANVSTSCGGLNTGGYYSSTMTSDVKDGSYTTKYTASADTESFLLVNYTIFSDVLYGSKIQIKYASFFNYPFRTIYCKNNTEWTSIGNLSKGTNSGGASLHTTNYTIDATCLNKPSLELNISLFWHFDDIGFTFSGNSQLYEEGMFWNITVPYTPPSSSCLWSGTGTWNINVSQNCNITTNYNLMGNLINMTGSGIVYTNSTITNFSLFKKTGTSSSNIIIYKHVSGAI